MVGTGITEFRTGVLALAVGMLLLGAIGLGTVVAQDDAGGSVDLDEAVSVYNDEVDDAPDFLRNRLADERIELRVGDGATMATSETGQAYALRTDGDGYITESDGDGQDDTTIRVLSSEETVDAIVASDEPGETFLEAYDDDAIEIEGVGLFKSLQVAFLEFVISVSRAIGII